MRKESGRSFVLIIIIIAVSALVLRIIIERVMKADLAQNEANASTTLKLISAALQNYAKDHGTFPENITGLVQANPSYLDKDYVVNSPINGYIYTCSKLAADGYSCTAIPSKCNLSGKFAYSVSTGGVFVAEECAKKENEIVK